MAQQIQMVRCEPVSDKQMEQWIAKIDNAAGALHRIPQLVGVPLSRAKCRTNGKMGYRGDVVRSIRTAAETGTKPEWLGPWYRMPVGPELPPQNRPWPVWGWGVAGIVGLTVLRAVMR